MFSGRLHCVQLNFKDTARYFLDTSSCWMHLFLVKWRFNDWKETKENFQKVQLPKIYVVLTYWIKFLFHVKSKQIKYWILFLLSNSLSLCPEQKLRYIKFANIYLCLQNDTISYDWLIGEWLLEIWHYRKLFQIIFLAFKLSYDLKF